MPLYISSISCQDNNFKSTEGKENVALFGFVDDNTISAEGEHLEDVLKKLKTCADNVITYLSSNKLVVNPEKIIFYWQGQIDANK